MSDGYIKPEYRSDPNEPFWDVVGRNLEREIRKLIREEIRSWIIERNQEAFKRELDVDFNEVRIEGERD